MEHSQHQGDYPPISRVALDTIFAMERPANWQDRPTLKWGRKLTDAELLGKLELNGVALRKDRLGDWVQNYVSAEEICRSEGLEHSDLHDVGLNADWVWIGVTILWERWYPDRQSMEMLDASMQSGYRASGVQQADHWLETWEILKDLAARANFSSVHAFDRIFRGTQSVFNWLTDCSDCFHNTSIDEPRSEFKQSQRQFIEWILEAFPDDQADYGSLLGDLGECIHRLDGANSADAYFKEWTESEPKNGEAWYYWSSSHFFSSAKDGFARAEAIVLEGLGTPNVTDKKMLQDRLRDIRGDLRPKNSSVAETTFSKPGRNAPCPCGSGKKYKKCCL